MSLDGPNWEVSLENAFALSAAICGWTILECSRHGFFPSANFHTLENEARHKRMKERISSLTGADLEEFRRMLLCNRNALLKLLNLLKSKSK
jgi:hypothetical protein